MQLYFIRHAQSVNNAIWEATGSSHGRQPDPDLTPVGEKQAEALAEYLAQPWDGSHDWDPQNRRGFGITHLYCSLMLRAVRTGYVVAERLNLPLHAWEDIHETGGVFVKDPETAIKVGLPGNGRVFFEQRFPRLVLPDSLDGSGWWNRPFEEREQVPARARRALQTLLRRHGTTDHRVAMISHGGFYNHFMAALFSLIAGEDEVAPTPKGLWRLLNNTGITRIDFQEDHITVVYQNRLDFLPADLIT